MNLNNIPVWHMEQVWETDRFQEWWLRRWHEPKGGSFSNIRIGDFFTLSKDNQVGIVTGKTIVCGRQPGPDFDYQIDGDIGGFWHRPRHEDFEEIHGTKSYFRFIPSATQLCELSAEFEDTGLEEWAFRLIEHYRNHPFDNTHRGHLAHLAREAKEF